MQTSQILARTALVAALAATSSLVLAGQIQGSTNGLSDVGIAPTTTVTFEGAPLPVQNSIVTNQYAAMGATFTTLYFNPDDSTAPYPQAITGSYLGNYQNGVDPMDPAKSVSTAPLVPSFTISYATVQTASAFGLAANSSVFNFEAFLNGKSVDFFSTLVNSTSATDPDASAAFFYGFYGEQFDSIVVTSVENDYFDFDNLQFGTATITPPLADPSAVPEPESVALLGLGLVGALSVRRRSRNAA